MKKTPSKSPTTVHLSQHIREVLSSLAEKDGLSLSAEVSLCISERHHRSQQ